MKEVVVAASNPYRSSVLRSKFGSGKTNKPVAPMGLLPMLDEEGRVVGGSDEGYLNKIRRVHKDNKRLKFKGPNRNQRTKPNEFWVHHYADHVKYDVTGFVDKNRDILQPDLESLMTSSNNNFISRTLFRPPETDSSSAGASEKSRSGKRGKGTRTQKTQGGLFFGQLKSLMGILSTSTPHYIRCIKPNNLKIGRLFSAGMCNRQLACSGVYEAVRIRQQGYPHRFFHHEFIRRYWTVAPHIVRGFDFSKQSNQTPTLAKPISQGIVSELESRVEGFTPSKRADGTQSSAGCLVGRTRVLIPETHFTWLEQYRTVIQQSAVYELQRVARGFIARSFCRSLTKSRKLLRAAITAGDVSSAQEILQRVKRRTGKRVGFLLEQQQVQQLVDQHRQRQKLTEILEAAQAGGAKVGRVSTFWESRMHLKEAHAYLTDSATGLSSEGSTMELSEADRMLLFSAKRAVGIVNNMSKARDTLMQAMDVPTVAGLSRAIAQATEMEQLHGTFCTDLLDMAKVVLNQAANSQMAGAPSARRAPPLPSKPAEPSRMEQAIAVGVDPAVYQAQMEALNAIGSMSTAIKSSWGRMSDDAKLKKLLLIEGLCESLRSSVFEGDHYRKWAQDRLGKLLFLIVSGSLSIYLYSLYIWYSYLFLYCTVCFLFCG